MERITDIMMTHSAGDTLVLVALMVLVMIVLIVVVTLFLLLRQYFFRLQKARVLRKRQRFNDLLVDCLFSDSQGDLEICKLKGRSGGRILYQSMMFLMHNFSGELSGKIRELFYQLNLERYLERDLYSGKWWKISRGLRDSRTMLYDKSVEVARKHVDSPRLELRVEAQLTLMALKVNEPFEFLNRLKRPFSTWARIHLYHEMTRWEQKPDATSWLHNSNPGVMEFALRVMGLLNQKADVNEVAPLLRHKDSRLRAEVVRYAALVLEKGLWFNAARKFKAEDVKVRERLAQTAGMVPGVPFSLVMDWFNREKSTVVKIELARTLLVFGKTSGLSSEEMDALGKVA
ncbi:hypothetical protein [Marinilabilia salmonicolor]|jgi:hypothetical protein|uniref:HEAT repeat protein n=1 Tax=Marinilabilia salmonicolor TaxID=989 RepID=A0A2T0XQV0_9BACT|nr:hypothetical protein [Marinilabilia salmonicolor]PRZ01310.1 hypothetical protein BY457_103125 [Marinilabilia salmonicolor]RCW39291.1 hypothetical protein DFO77_10159 [Marinilabilia salmonicolor]